jgi:hypothetical protein
MNLERDAKGVVPKPYNPLICKELTLAGNSVRLPEQLGLNGRRPQRNFHETVLRGGQGSAKAEQTEHYLG